MRVARGGLGALHLAAARKAFVEVERRALVREARAARASGRLALGDFLLRAGAIDAREQGRAVDLDGARALYDERLARLRQQTGAKLVDAVPQIFSDFHYFGSAGGSVVDALIERGGSCEPLAQLIAATIHDAGHRELARLRYYGGEGADGATHLAPVMPEGRVEHDLLTGSRARRGGVLLDAEDLVEVYARAHGLSPPLAARGPATGGSGEGAGRGPPPQASTMARGYPPNGDRFPGAVPLYAQRAVRARTDAAEAPAGPAIDATDCAFFVRLASLDPPSIGLDGERGGAFEAELRRVPRAAHMDRTFAVVQTVERQVAAKDVDPTDRLMGLACLVALYDDAAVGFELGGDHRLATRSAAQGAKARRSGEEALAAIDWDGADGARMLADLAGRYAGRSFLLLLLRGGDAPVMKLAASAHHDWGRVNALAALVVAPATRQAGIALVQRASEKQQIQVMHEIFHAHDHQRPWGSNYPLASEGEGVFPRAYRAFRGLSWGLWEGARPPAEVLSAMVREAERGALGPAWTTALVEYYGRNAIALHRHRPDWPSFSAELAGWLRENGFAQSALYAEAQGGVQQPI
jgi:hypothetical protein